MATASSLLGVVGVLGLIYAFTTPGNQILVSLAGGAFVGYSIFFAGVAAVARHKGN